MASISNIKIARKLALILGGNVLLLTALSALSLWGLRSSEHTAESVKDGFEEAQLVATITAETSALGQNSGKMIIGKKATEEIVSRILESRQNRLEAVAKFKERAKTQARVLQAEEMAELVKANAAANNHIIAFLHAGRYADAAQEFNVASAVSQRVRDKAQELARQESQLLAEYENRRKQSSSALWIALITGSLFAVSAAVLGGVVLARSIAAPLASAVSHLDRIAQGDLSRNTPAEAQARGDEIGTLARAMQTMTLALRKMIEDVSSGIEVLSTSSTEMTVNSTEMSAGSRHASDKAHSVSAATEQMISNIASVAAGMEQTTANLTHIASATDEMTSTIGEIAQNSEKARRITDEATRQAARITDQIDQLGLAAREIGKVTETITEISSQTNLLALNATIESARAGAAGKGFAVVATEIKALAQQTAAATEDIKGRIAGVQAATAGGVAEIGKVSQVILDVSAIVASIAAAMEEQSAATKNIARNINEASAGLNDANSRVSETAHVSREIAKDMVKVDEAAGEMANGSDRVRRSASALSQVAADLKGTVAGFHA